MKRKNYKVRIKLEYTATMNHSQTSKEKAKQDVEKVIRDYINEGRDMSNIFDNPPELKFKVEVDHYE